MSSVGYSGPDVRQIAARAYEERAIAEQKALDALGRYKFQMFGYWAGVWVHLNRIVGDKRPSPFKHVVLAARCAPDFVAAALGSEKETP